MGGLLKLNVDAVVFIDPPGVGVGVVIRDHCGVVVAACSKLILGGVDAITAEAKAVSCSFLV